MNTGGTAPDADPRCNEDSSVPLPGIGILLASLWEAGRRLGSADEANTSVASRCLVYILMGVFLGLALIILYINNLEG